MLLSHLVLGLVMVLTVGPNPELAPLFQAAATPRDRALLPPMPPADPPKKARRPYRRPIRAQGPISTVISHPPR